MTCSVLDLIDGAIRQYGDAMRWSPDPQAHQPDGVEVPPETPPLTYATFHGAEESECARR